MTEISFDLSAAKTELEKAKLVIEALLEMGQIVCEVEDMDYCTMLQGLITAAIAVQVEMDHEDCAQGLVDRLNMALAMRTKRVGDH